MFYFVGKIKQGGKIQEKKNKKNKILKGLTFEEMQAEIDRIRLNR